MPSILVVDDNQDLVNSLVAVLTLAGHPAEAAYNGPQALERVRDSEPHAVVLDIGLPIMDGYEVCRVIRAEITNYRPILVALSGRTIADSDRVKAIEAGFDGYLRKPISADLLIEVIESLAKREPVE